MTYPPTNEHSWEYALLKLTESIASNIVDGAPLSSDFVENFQGLVAQGMSHAVEELGAPDGTLSHMLNLNYAALQHLFGNGGTTTLMRMLRELETRSTVAFEPLVGQSLPTHLYTFSWRGDLMPIVRLPSPTSQERIDVAIPSEILQIAARRHGRKIGKYLLVNLQDRTGWKDGARCQAIEELSRTDEAINNISVVALTRDGDFYRQEGSFEDISNAERFKDELLDHMTEPARGVLLPNAVSTSMGSELKDLIEALHKYLYGGRNVLTKVQRLEFIDLIHLLLILRVIEEIHPDMVFISCKDGLDASLVTIGSLFAFLKLINHRPSSEEEKDWLGASLLGLPLIKRDRLLFAESYSRMTGLIRLLEGMSFEETEDGASEAVQAIIKFLPQEIAYAAMLPATGRQPTYFDRRYPI